MTVPVAELDDSEHGRKNKQRLRPDKSAERTPEKQNRLYDEFHQHLIQLNHLITKPKDCKRKIPDFDRSAGR
jgi:hypothetical protein